MDTLTDLAPPTPRELAEAGATAPEIAAALGIPVADAALQAGPITPAQLRRVEQVALSRAIGHDGLAPHVQAAQFMLAAHAPDLYGRQAAGAAPALVVVVDSQFRERARGDRYIDAEPGDTDPSPRALAPPA